MVYYGLVFNAGSLVKGSIYVNIAVQSVLELFSYIVCLFAMDNISRRFLYCGSLILSGIACLSMVGPVFAKKGAFYPNILNNLNTLFNFQNNSLYI